MRILEISNWLYDAVTKLLLKMSCIIKKHFFYESVSIYKK